MSVSEISDPAELYAAIETAVTDVMVGNRQVVEHLTVALLTRGHVLIEGVPGVAKTTLANLFAHATGLDYSRIQMTPDLMPADITGTQVYRHQRDTFELHRGPIFANVVVADEINRATPKTQSALLEAMQEGRVTIEGETLELPDPFMVIATQNPLEFEGVFELPEAQRDRFQLKSFMGIPNREHERELLRRFDEQPTLGPEAVDQVVSVVDIQSAREYVAAVTVAESVVDYIHDVVTATRAHPDVAHGASPRALIALQSATKARAAIAGRDYVIPNDLKVLVEQVLQHRLVLTTDADLSDVTPGDVIADVLDSVEPPSGTPGTLADSDD